MPMPSEMPAERGQLFNDTHASVVGDGCGASRDRARSHAVSVGPVFQYYGIALPIAHGLPRGISYAVGDSDLRAVGAEHGISRAVVQVSPDGQVVVLVLEGDESMTPDAGWLMQRVLERKGLPSGGDLREFADERELMQWAREHSTTD